MPFTVTDSPALRVAGFHLTGPWEQTVRQGFDQLGLWLQSHPQPAPRWLCAYYGNPQVEAPEKLRCITAIAVDDHFALTGNSEGMEVSQLAGGRCAVATAEIIDDDYAAPWLDFFAQLLSQPGYAPDPQRPCLEFYPQWDSPAGPRVIEMWIPLASEPERAGAAVF